MRRSASPYLAAALGVLLFVDVLRVCLPSIITTFGQAAATPAELMGAFALLWFVLALAAPALFRTVGADRIALVAALTLVGSRALLPATGGGPAQLYLASVGLLAGLVWLAGLAANAPTAVPGLVVGLAAGTVLHTALGTYDLVWRGPEQYLLLVPVAVGFVAAQRTVGGPDPDGPARPWFLVGPALLLWGMLAGSPALAATGASYLAGALAGTDRVAVVPPGGALPLTVLVAAAVGLFLVTGLAAERHRPPRWLYPAALVLGTALFAAGWPLALPVAIPLAAAGLGGCLALASTPTAPAPAGTGGAGGSAATTGPNSTNTRRAYATLAGTLVFVVAAIGYYAAYDLGYPNGWLPLLVAVVVATLAIRAPAPAVPVEGVPVGPVPGIAAGPTRTPRRPWSRSVVVAGTSLAVVAGLLTASGAGAADPFDGNRVRLVAYNIRMGFGLDGRFDLPDLTRTIAGQRPDVVVLSEVDRAWLLNGGHDTLALLAARLDMGYHFAPAADPVWGDAVLTRLPVDSAGTVALPAVGAPTGAQALGVVLRVGDRELVVVSTHLQPPPDGGPVEQARTVARYAAELAAGRPLVLAGDLNTQPGEPAFQALLERGLTDALAADRPLPTSPADRPVEQIDHVLVSDGLAPSDITAVPGTASDHLAVALTLTLPLG
ncbi:endonuclease/exonuclease/phosphatase family metal-dependent hydrolase [Micromonospora pisi]|uniref:Endonuclease/exonuclease/phosphatase family metal-dependent hydrolase n=1 Tax=Micromonospora pisi TaxID=589240 RepID=A0A495JRI4_9ACTN|nr:endonuclease/exonuclease/phosphatase family protein [Micromonospora pisi]RKR90679.1 endonuclease/exonuclease/phosphatase family metal-dependent hydrolase [Micromonospora pisi]